MAENSRIEWTDHTFNPWVGCTKVSPACGHCYAETWARRTGHAGLWNDGERRRTSAANWRLPHKWNAQAGREGRRFRVFCASLADVFDNTVPDEWRADLFVLIRETPHLDWLLLTKRVGNALPMIGAALTATVFRGNGNPRWPWRNVWLGATICNQVEADRDIPKLLATPAAVRFLSIEPMLGPIDLDPLWLRACPSSAFMAGKVTPDMPAWTRIGAYALDWVICGGESGHGARPMHPSWPRSLRDQCASAGVPFFFKQHGEWLATDLCDDDQAILPSRRTVYVSRQGSFHDGRDGVDFFGGEEETAWVGKKAAGAKLDGRLHREFPR